MGIFKKPAPFDTTRTYVKQLCKQMLQDFEALMPPINHPGVTHGEIASRALERRGGWSNERRFVDGSKFVYIPTKKSLIVSFEKDSLFTVIQKVAHIELDFTLTVNGVATEFVRDLAHDVVDEELASFFKKD